MRFAYGKYDPISNKDNVKRLVHDVSKRLKLRYDIELNEKEIIHMLDDEVSYASVYNAVMSSFLLKKPDSNIWGEKTNLAWTKIPGFLEMFPNGTVVHVIRDPRAVLASWKNFTNAPGNDYLDSILNCYDSMKSAKEYKKLYDNDNYIVVKYEDLVSETEETLISLCQKIGVKFDVSMIDVNSFTGRNGEKWRANTVYDIEIKGISVEMIDKWKTKLNGWEVFLTEQLTGSLMGDYGYQLSSSTKKSEYADKAIVEVQKSNLAAEGLIRYLVKNESFERYPSDPSDSRNWGTIKNKKIVQ